MVPERPAPFPLRSGTASSGWAAGVAAPLALALPLLLPAPLHAHARGLYATQAEAEQRARELGCEGTHRNEGRWMPCRDEAHLHQHLRRQ